MKRLVLLSLVLAGSTPAPAAQDVAVHARVVHTAAGAPLEDAVVLVTAGKISAVGKASAVSIPAGVTTLDAAVVMPGLAPANSSLGLACALNYADDREDHERSRAVQSALRAIDAYHPPKTLIEWARGFGVTTEHTGHAPGAVISGQTTTAKLRGET